MTRVYDEIVEFIAKGSTPGAVASFQPSFKTQERLEKLLDRNRSSALTSEEEDELKHYLELEHIMRLAKARARKHLQ